MSSIEIFIADYLKVAQKKRVLVFIILFLSFASGILVSSISKPVFRAEMVIYPVSEVSDSGRALTQALGQLGAIVGISQQVGGGVVQRNLELLQSKELASSFLREYELVSAVDEMGKGFFTNAVEMLGFGLNERGVDQVRNVKYFLRHLVSIRVDSRTNIVHMSLDWSDPVEAAKVANNFVVFANNYIANLDREQSKSRQEFLERRISEVTNAELRNVFYDLLKHSIRMEMTTSLDSFYAFQVLDPAVPDYDPFWPKTGRVIALFVFFGVALVWLVLVFFRATDK